IATGTDIKPLEIVVFMRAVKSRTFFEQMKGRGVRVISEHDLQQVNPGPVRKDHFVIVDAVGVCEADRTDSRPMDQKKSIPFEKLLQAVALGNTEPEVLSSVAARLARLDKNLIEPDKVKIAEAAGGATLKDLAGRIVAALNPDNLPQAANPSDPAGEPTTIPSPPAGEGQGEGVYALQARIEAVKPLYNPKLRNLLIELKKKSEQIIDSITPDAVLEAGFSEAARERARRTVESFEQFIADHRDEITALQILYSRPRRLPLRFEDLKTLAETLQAPPRLWTESQLWQAYAALDKSRVKGASQRRIMTDLVLLVRFAMHQENELVPFPERVAANFKAWLGQQEAAGRSFTPEQRKWLEMIRDHIAANLGIDVDDFEYAPFAQEGGIGKVHQVFGDSLPLVLAELNEKLAA
ncbi:MAG TPA: type I restriction-modification enzyme R subunit C-terminal domain-containing protein, partial [Desulfobacterales bacterium]|nr:type I restriction-modification enzyme R subunit C-terminal domain-containing protein [Desulfobacterales bacterium]